ncbi:hypothetical protein [Enterobacter kobei]|uniref:hypothetical protein n=1 Tax=Enterobacter kobei TaxID=208224 RepID=UPI00200484C9|nr:hypothetical protein [Enterobacter kobei]MCK6891111.1 hypothetical protein [Enterobacter kobei]
MLRRGFTSDEIQRMPLNEFYELWFFDTFVEPQGPVVQDYAQARLLYYINVNNPNITEKGIKKLNVKDFMKTQDKVFKSKEELEQERKKAEEANRIKMESMFDPKLLEKAKRMSKRNG